VDLQEAEVVMEVVPLEDTEVEPQVEDMEALQEAAADMEVLLEADMVDHLEEADMADHLEEADMADHLEEADMVDLLEEEVMEVESPQAERVVPVVPVAMEADQVATEKRIKLAEMIIYKCQLYRSPTVKTTKWLFEEASFLLCQKISFTLTTIYLIARGQFCEKDNFFSF